MNLNARFVISLCPAAAVLVGGLIAGMTGPLPPARSQGMIPHRICDWQSTSFQKNLSLRTADIWTSLKCDGGGLDGCYVELVWGIYCRDAVTGYWMEMGWESTGRMGPYCGSTGLRERAWAERKYLPRGVECCLSVTAYNRTHSSPEPLGSSFLYWTN